jgi:hypothetical protein
VRDGGRGEEAAEVGRVRETHGACASPSAVGVLGFWCLLRSDLYGFTASPSQRSVLDFCSFGLLYFGGKECYRVASIVREDFFFYFSFFKLYFKK